jgi:hypothetical protein
MVKRALLFANNPTKGVNVNTKSFNWLQAILAISVFISAVAARAQTITPYQPSGWSDKVVVTTTSGSTTDTSPLFTTNDLYVDWAIANTTGTPANSTFYVDLYTNSVFVKRWTYASLPSLTFTDIKGFHLGHLPVGVNTIELVPDATEVYENPPNTYTKTITIFAATLPSLSIPVLSGPSNGSTGQPITPVFSWSAVSNAASYEIIVATNAADLPTDTNATSGGVSVVINANTTNTTYTPLNPLVPGTKYYWEVNARVANVGGPWSATGNYTSANSPAGLTILPVFDSSITSDPQAVAIESTIRAACAVYQSAFSDPITVSITFQEMGSGLGQSSWEYYTFSYTQFRAALVSKATTPDDFTALAHLPVQTGNPLNNNSTINVKTAQAYDLGLISGENVGTISLYTGIMNLTDTQSNPNNYSLFSTACHEIDEVLGTGSALDEVAQGHNTTTGPIFGEDLFRYDSSGNRNYTTSSSDTSYFSIDGTTDLAQFNQFSGGDFGDWYSYQVTVVPEVQDAFATPGVSPNPAVELRALDVLGYHYVVQAPTPNFVSVKRSGSTIKLVWGAAATRSYQVLYSTSLTSPVWNDLGSSITATSSTATNTDTIGGQERFYKVELLATSGNAPSVNTPNIKMPQSQVVIPPTGWGTNVFHPRQP